MREVHLLNPLVGLGKHFRMAQLDQTKMRDNSGEERRLKPVKQEILLVGHRCAPLPGRREREGLSVTDAYGQAEPVMSETSVF